MPGRRGRDRLWRRGSRRRRARRHGAAEDRRRRSISPPSRARLETLPRYARPLFLRLDARNRDDRDPQAEARAPISPKGSIPRESSDPLYVYDGEANAYVALDAERFAAIASGAMRRVSPRRNRRAHAPARAVAGESAAGSSVRQSGHGAPGGFKLF